MGSKRLHIESFIQKAQAIHGLGKYDYSQTIFAHTKRHLTIICPLHGAFEQIAGSHLTGHGCPECGKIIAASKPRKRHTTERFIMAAREKHGELYDYSLVVYNRAIEEVEIICPVHGTFKQLPYTHLRGAGCQKCVGSNVAKSHIAHTLKWFIDQCKTLHPTLDFTQTEYKGRRLKVDVVCPVHGFINLLPSTLLKGNGCTECSRPLLGPPRKGRESFIESAQKTHGTAYSYDEIPKDFLISDRVPIKCSVHGIFQQIANSHLAGRGCAKCSFEQLKGGAIGWTRTRWIARQRDRLATLYVFRLQGGDELFYKVGITYNPQQRIAQFPYDTQLIQLFQSQNAAIIYNLERVIKAEFKHLRYKPQKKFGGGQECYNSFNEILSYLQSVCPAE
jgi:hypothetical protein